MAEQPSPIQFEDVPLEEARRLGRGPRMDLQLYQELRMRIQPLSEEAVRMTIPDGTRPNTMKNRLLRRRRARDSRDHPPPARWPALLALQR
jgi:hypothetical protein